MCKPQKTVLTGPKIARLDSIRKFQAMQEETLNVPKRNYYQQVKPSGLWAKLFNYAINNVVNAADNNVMKTVVYNVINVVQNKKNDI